MFKKVKNYGMIALGQVIHIALSWHVYPILIAYMIRHRNDPDYTKKVLEFKYMLVEKYTLIGLVAGRDTMNLARNLIETTDFSK